MDAAKQSPNGQDWLEPDWAKDAATDLGSFLSAQCAPPSDLPMWQWWEENIVLDYSGPMPGRYRTEFTPMVRWVADACQNPRVRRVVVQVSAQSAKTQMLLNLLNWIVCEDPGPTMWVMAQSDHMSEFVQKRLLPAVEYCERARKHLVESKKGLFVFDSMNLMLRGSNSRAKLQSDPVRRLICDERREWAPGAIELLRKRTRTFHNFQEVSVGTAGTKGDELDTDYHEGSQTMAHVRCLECGHSQPIRFGKQPSALFPTAREKGGFVWDEDDVTRPGGVWNFPEVHKTVRWECEQCGHRYEDAEKHELFKTLHPVDHNPAAPADKKSFHWSAFTMIWETCSWPLLVEEFLRAVMAAKDPDSKNIEPLKAFITETLGEPWEDQLGVIEDFEFLESRKGDYEYGEAWAEETVRFMSADKQQRGGEHYWYVVRAFGRFGKSRLIAYGRVSSYMELLETAKLYKVPMGNCMIDSGYEGTQVYRFVMGTGRWVNGQWTGWKAFKGDSSEYYLHQMRDAQNPTVTRTVRRLWRKSLQDPFIGTAKAKRVPPVPLFMFAGDPTKDLLANFTTGVMGDWTLPRTISREFMKMMSAEQREECVDPKGHIRYVWKQIAKDNHMLDCELMILVAALIKGVISHKEESEARAERGDFAQKQVKP